MKDDRENRFSDGDEDLSEALQGDVENVPSEASYPSSSTTISAILFRTKSYFEAKGVWILLVI